MLDVSRHPDRYWSLWFMLWCACEQLNLVFPIELLIKDTQIVYNVNRQAQLIGNCRSELKNALFILFLLQVVSLLHYRLKRISRQNCLLWTPQILISCERLAHFLLQSIQTSKLQKREDVWGFRQSAVKLDVNGIGQRCAFDVSPKKLNIKDARFMRVRSQCKARAIFKWLTLNQKEY